MLKFQFMGVVYTVIGSTRNLILGQAAGTLPVCLEWSDPGIEFIK